MPHGNVASPHFRHMEICSGGSEQTLSVSYGAKHLAISMLQAK